MKPGTRIYLNDNCVWPERRGAIGVVIAPPADGSYPQPGPSEVLVLLDADPLRARDMYDDQKTRGWTCVTGRDSIEEIPSNPRTLIVAALTARAGELADLHHVHVRLDANAREKIADVVLDALGLTP